MEILKIHGPCLKLVLRVVSVSLRVLEISFALFILFYVSSRVPTALRHSLNFFLRLLNFVASPAFAFCLCTAIIAVVFTKASRLAAGDQTVGESSNGMIEIGDDHRDHWTLSLLLPDSYDEEDLCEKTAVCGDEKIAGQIMNVATFCEEEELESNKGPSVPDFDEDRSNDGDEGTMSCEKVRMGNDELKRRVEDFIAKELRFRREESSDIVLPSY